MESDSVSRMNLWKLLQVKSVKYLPFRIPSYSPYLKEALEALLALGYTKTEVKKTGRKLLDFKGDSTDEYLRQALRLMMNK